MTPKPQTSARPTEEQRKGHGRYVPAESGGGHDRGAVAGATQVHGLNLVEQIGDPARHAEAGDAKTQQQPASRPCAGQDANAQAPHACRVENFLALDGNFRSKSQADHHRTDGTHRDDHADPSLGKVEPAHVDRIDRLGDAERHRRRAGGGKQQPGAAFDQPPAHAHGSLPHGTASGYQADRWQRESEQHPDDARRGHQEEGGTVTQPTRQNAPREPVRAVGRCSWPPTVAPASCRDCGGRAGWPWTGRGPRTCCGRGSPARWTASGRRTRRPGKAPPPPAR